MNSSRTADFLEEVSESISETRRLSARMDTMHERARSGSALQRAIKLAHRNLSDLEGSLNRVLLLARSRD
jgi:hypothetical protein